MSLTPLKQRSGKIVHAWAAEGDIDPASVVSNTFLMEWPPRSGKQQKFPEIDRGEWFTIATAKEKMIPGQRGFVVQLQDYLDSRPSRRA
jgi:predicted NUDIX family NTP pyrophosphohydrolase